MSAPFFLGKVIDIIYTTASDTEAMTASLTSMCGLLAGAFLCGGAANATRVYLIQLSGETGGRTNRAEETNSMRCALMNFFSLFFFFLFR